MVFSAILSTTPVHRNISSAVPARGSKGKMRRTTLTIIISTVLAVFASLVVPPRAGDLYFDLEVAAKFPTSIKIYFDTGLGFNQQQSSSRKLPGRSEPWMLRFKLPGEIV